MRAFVPVIAVSALLLAGCADGGSGGPPATGVTVAQFTPSPSPAGSTSVSGPAALPSSQSEDFSGTGGYRARVTVQTGLLVHAVAGAVNGTATLGRSCKINPQIDAAAPFRIIMTNRTDRADVQLSAQWLLNGTDLVGRTHFEAELAFTSGSECTAGGGAAGQPENLTANSALAPGKGITVDGFLVAHNYYPPDKPGGDTATMCGAGFYFLDVYAATSQTWLSNPDRHVLTFRRSPSPCPSVS